MNLSLFDTQYKILIATKKNIIYWLEGSHKELMDKMRVQKNIPNITNSINELCSLRLLNLEYSSAKKSPKERNMKRITLQENNMANISEF